MGQAGKYLLRIVGLGFAGAILLAAGCSVPAWLPGKNDARLAQLSNGVTAFFLAIGMLLLIGAVITMLLWAAKSARS